MEATVSDTKQKIRLAVFDFDGTLITTQSGTKLAFKLSHDGFLTKKTYVKLLFWGIKYKTHLPYDEKQARELIFKSFAHKKAEAVDAYIDKFYESKIDDKVNNKLLTLAEQLQKDNIELVILSAAFTATIQSFAKRHGFIHLVGTDMEINDQGYYTGKVKGDCVAGKEKINSFVKYADATFGKDSWILEYAFADHYTDIPLMEMANYPCAVDPCKTLRWHAKKCGWEIIDLEEDM